MSNTPLDFVTIKGFKSIKSLDNFKLNSLNVIVGANGAGKSNFIAFFRLLSALMEGNLNRFIRDSGGANDQLHLGAKHTKKIEFSTRFSDWGYRFDLVSTPNNDVALQDEARFYLLGSSGWWKLGDNSLGQSNMVAEIKNNTSDRRNALPVYNAITSWKIYHFHDTSSTAPMRKYEIVQDNKSLRTDAANIGAFLLKLKNDFQSEYKEITNAIKLVTPFFDDFQLEPRKSGEKEEVNLSWHQKGSDYPMQPYHLSDGSIRFICLATALLQPNPPSTIIIDEPELGLHPAAIAILAELIKSASERTQVVIATQSPELINHFSIDDIIVANRKDSATTLTRLKEEDFESWLEDYSIGELWNKNIITGGPVHE